VVDPQLDVEPYLEAAAEKSMAITHIFETHVQADHLSGARRLAAVTGAPVLVHESAEVRFPHREVGHGDEHEMGNVRMTILHTPGHTPESVSILVTDRTRAPEPWFVLTGDTLFSGGVGRPDLLGAGAEERLAGQLFDSLHGVLVRLPDHIEIYPAHFGGAACGKGLSGKPGSTVGFERRFNPALQQRSKADFVQFVLADLPPQPAAFAETRRRNLTGEA
jgi:hydroxyacylglutathione hydrolase